MLKHPTYHQPLYMTAANGVLCVFLARWTATFCDDCYFLHLLLAVMRPRPQLSRSGLHPLTHSL